MLSYAVSKVLDDDNLLIEILVRLGFPNTLVRAALVCKRWLRHASDPVFLCRFCKLHPPRLLGFYLDVRPLSWGRTTHLCFVPMLPQPAELNVIARRVATYSLDAYHNVWIEDCHNGSILKGGAAAAADLSPLLLDLPFSFHGNPSLIVPQHLLVETGQGTIWIDCTAVVKIIQVRENAESACLQIG